MEKYILVEWPESQMLMEHERFNECLFVQDIDGHVEVGSSAYMCPEDLYEKIFNTDNIKSKRIGNLMFRKATYLGEEPEFPSWHIDFFYPNPCYGYNKNTFVHKESCYAIAHFTRDNEGYYELGFIGDRPLSLNEQDIKDFWELVRYGNEELNKLNEDA